MILKKQILYIFIVFFTFACAHNIHAMRCGIKLLTQPSKARFLKIQIVDLTKLQQIRDSLENIEPICFDTVEKTNPCKYQDSCCLLAKNSAQLAKKGKAVRLEKIATENDADTVDAVYIDILKDKAKRLVLLQQKNEEAQNIFSESQFKEALEPFYKELCELTRNISECLTYSANIYGTTFYECSGRYYEKNPRGLFDSTKHMTLQEREREKLQNECNKINKIIMKSNGYPLNLNILLGWGAHTMDPDYIGAWLDGIERSMRAHDDYVKGGGSVY